MYQTDLFQNYIGCVSVAGNRQPICRDRLPAVNYNNIDSLALKPNLN